MSVHDNAGVVISLRAHLSFDHYLFAFSFFFNFHVTDKLVWEIESHFPWLWKISDEVIHSLREIKKG